MNSTLKAIFLMFNYVYIYYAVKNKGAYKVVYSDAIEPFLVPKQTNQSKVPERTTSLIFLSSKNLFCHKEPQKKCFGCKVPIFKSE